jgi:hypothetical protein
VRPGLGLAALRADPDWYGGPTLNRGVLIIGRQTDFRSDTVPGERELLVPDLVGELSFPNAFVRRVGSASENLAPLQRIGIVGRVGTASSPLTGHPILDPIEFRR